MSNPIGKLTITPSSSSVKDYSHVFTVSYQEGTYSEDVTEVKEALEEIGYEVEDKSQHGKLKVFSPERGEQ